MPSGIIIKGIGGFYYVLSGEALFECKARGIFRKDDISPLPGDMVNFSVIDNEKRKGSIDEILPRTSRLVRPAVSNVDQVAAVIAVRSPAPDYLLLDKLLVTAEKENINPVICINKIDLDADREYEKTAGLYSKAGYRTIPASSSTGEGFDELKAVLKGRITVFAGQSGVGKSTILNIIMNSMVMKTGILSEKTERGRHTTRHAELVRLDSGGYVVDTPGFSSFELPNMDFKDLQLYYPEFGGIEDKCRFAGCSHVNEPDCSVKAAVLSGFVSEERYKRYIEFYSYLKLNDSLKYKKTNKEREKQ